MPLAPLIRLIHTSAFTWTGVALYSFPLTTQRLTLATQSEPSTPPLMCTPSLAVAVAATLMTAWVLSRILVILAPAGIPVPDTVRPTQVAVKIERPLALTIVFDPLAIDAATLLLASEAPRLSPPASTNVHIGWLGRPKWISACVSRPWRNRVSLGIDLKSDFAKSGAKTTYVLVAV